MTRMKIKDSLIVLNLGGVERDDLIVQVADFCLQFEGVEWVAIAGKLGNNLSIAVRNYGTGRDNAGEAAKNLFGEIGSAGGHRNMAKAVIPLSAWRKREGSVRDSFIETRLRELFTAEITRVREHSETAGKALGRNGN
jgi:nanoRNase/pAp phosphatase (c-di-AMP/oligoRNAs hydrolase)